MLTLIRGIKRKLTESRISASDCGFSLIEVAIGLLIIGLLATPAIIIYENEKQQREINNVEGKLDTIKKIVENYVAREERYPRPARIILPLSDPDAGTEFPGNPNCNAMAGTGVCRHNDVLIGAIPYAELGLNPEDTLDPWGRKILYAVTQGQTNAGTYQRGQGRVKMMAIIDDAGTVDEITSPIDGYYDLVLVSMGPSGKGAYSANGDLIEECENLANPEREDENCNLTDTFFARSHSVNNETYGSISHVEGANFYDDFVGFIVEPTLNNWFQHNDPDFAMTQAHRIGIGTTSPDAAVHVAGDIKAVGVKADQICPNSATSCFHPKTIAGDEPGMRCTNVNGVQSAVLKLQNEQVTCAAPANSSGGGINGVPFVFPSGQFTPGSGAGLNGTQCGSSGKIMIGMNNGVPVCGP